MKKNSLFSLDLLGSPLDILRSLLDILGRQLTRWDPTGPLRTLLDPAGSVRDVGSYVGLYVRSDVRSDVGSDVRSGVRSDVGLDVGSDVRLDVGSDEMTVEPKRRNR